MRFTRRCAATAIAAALYLFSGAGPVAAAGPGAVVYRGAAGRSAFEAASQASGGAFQTSFAGAPDQPVGWVLEAETSVPHADVFASGQPVPDCDQPGGIAACPITEIYARGQPGPGVHNGIVSGVLALSVEIGSTAASIVSLDFDRQPAYAWGATFSGANGGSGVGITLVYLDASAPTGFVREALRDATGNDLYPVGDGFFGFAVPASRPLAKIELRPRALSPQGLGTEAFSIGEMLGSVRVILVPEPGSVPLLALAAALLAARPPFRRAGRAARSAAPQ